MVINEVKARMLLYSQHKFASKCVVPDFFVHVVPCLDLIWVGVER